MNPEQNDKKFAISLMKSILRSDNEWINFRYYNTRPVGGPVQRACPKDVVEETIEIVMAILRVYTIMYIV